MRLTPRVRSKCRRSSPNSGRQRPEISEQAFQDRTFPKIYVLEENRHAASSAAASPDSRCRLRLVKLHLNLVLMLAGLRQIVGRLHSYPNVGRSTEGLGKTDRHVGRHACLAVNETRKSGSADA